MRGEQVCLGHSNRSYQTNRDTSETRYSEMTLREIRRIRHRVISASLGYANKQEIYAFVSAFDVIGFALVIGCALHLSSLPCAIPASPLSPPFFLDNTRDVTNVIQNCILTMRTVSLKISSKIHEIIHDSLVGERKRHAKSKFSP